ncbi:MULTISPECIES: ATP synthase subunit I [Pseudoalteromonas]|uniref:ATP synthase subunit I n=1 Tax=Pseudoalteromonas TaxID=53246 RepID=UPI000783AF5E|nr:MULTISPECIES: ATP synthase subunit I [Gammaproteobacteria]MCF7502090.1 ATP synthase subunit I [Pseudoalteromonas sp. L1]MCF7520374.1 ATP synthase subunit I [Pseudoalteromonas sp. L21]RZF95028.1 F0F1 ATP synthase assembly protein I [Pseudoalteromonas sp. CO302Y]RZG11618.1 F0F1 ATP synthase assembly protein I [Pseudoalteromonas sp. CO133X]WOC26301.1 ATP synthase subunit I [Pseudoalteromonas sp. N1230-9]
MTNKLAKPYRLAAFKLICLQGIVALIAAVIVFVGWGVNAGQSALAGGAVALLPNFVFVVYAFRYMGASRTNQVYASLKRGNGLKFMLTIVLFALILKSYTVILLPFFCVYVLVLFSGLFAPVFFNH